MLVFIDTEFTNHNRPSLISIGLAAVGGNDFYAELTDYKREDCSEFVVAEILPLLGRSPEAACTSQELIGRLQEWFDALPSLATIVYDYEVDWQLLKATFHEELPPNVAGHQLIDHRIFRTSAYKLGEVLTYTKALPEHHALADARALREGYLRWSTRLTT
ncbi:hypothetical protein GTP44_11805 [Duganella sp. FT50W]|uniref:Uncharacterized protein n=1 Tax=Duganella lactea TaxID=2692173 RepID=A0A6L8MQH1_9BURK|nr:3'-5' exoribonuclease [Duganella lactea]MYM82638.1 hypothetical protein [Duganella lactea]